MQPKTVDIFDFALSLRTLEGEVRLEQMPELAKIVKEIQDDSLRFTAVGVGTIRGLPAVSLTIEGTVMVTCARCMDLTAVDIDREVTFLIVKSEAEADRLPLDEEGEDEDVIVGSQHFSLAQWVQEEAILSIPAMPMHDDCDVDWEPVDEPADEAPVQEKENPFAALAALKTKN